MTLLGPLDGILVHPIEFDDVTKTKLFVTLCFLFIFSLLAIIPRSVVSLCTAEFDSYRFCLWFRILM